ncbi:RNA polymerase sigma factor [Prosthecobacter sp.]|uniref:RNA polymerase sigma factor n=1 Tax=Prosthecobacter sp. TaxID=1965333 RepID=UPI001E09B7B3|nr:RNA polymerase sigma factor [Prosthecobacter sp.]MCB1278541.1 RNA polymerase sigma factor [Prosthecobacter sp.]
MTALPASIDLLLTEPDAALREDVEQQKIRAAQAGDIGAFEWLVQRHEERMFGFCCRWLRCTEDAREVCQDMFVRAWQALPEFEGRAKFSRWLYQIALNLCRDRLKSRFSRQRENTIGLNELAESPSCPRNSPDESAGLNSEMEKLGRGLALLPEKLRATLMLITMEGLSHQECAEVLNCSVRGVEGRLYRARQMLMQWWNEER